MQDSETPIGDNTDTPGTSTVTVSEPAGRRRSASRPAGPPAASPIFQVPEFSGPLPPREDDTPSEQAGGADGSENKPAKRAPAKRAPAKQASAKPDKQGKADKQSKPDKQSKAEEQDDDGTAAESSQDVEFDDDEDGDASQRRRRRRGGRGRRKKSDLDGAVSETDSPDDEPTSAPQDDVKSDGDSSDTPSDADTSDGDDGSSTRRRRRRRRRGESDGRDTQDSDDGADHDDVVAQVKGSTRIEAKKQRRREGREAGRRRPPVVSEAEFLARRESVERVMAVRQNGNLAQIGVLEDGVLVEHYVSRGTDEQPMVGNVYLGRVQNVLPAMEAAFVDIGRGRNAVIYAGEVDWSGLGHVDGQPKKIEDVLKSGQAVLVQVTKEPMGHKGARLTGQVSLPGRYVVYVPGGSMSGISRKLPENERNRLKKILKQVVPEDAGVIVRTAAEGASEEELTHDVARLRSQWEEIAKKTSGQAPQLLHGEPDLAIKVVRDLFNEDFAKLVVSGEDSWQQIESYVSYVASSLRDRLEPWSGAGDIFAAYRIDEQLAKALERKVWLPSGGSLVIDRTEAMTVIDVNTGKFTGSGGNLEETVTKNNLEAAEEVVRQLRLRDIGGIIVIDFIDMVLESNRELVLRRLVECLGRDRTKHQVAEVTSLGLVQMTRKRIGSGLFEAFTETCESCNGRGVHVHADPVTQSAGQAGPSGRNDRGERNDRRSRRRRNQPAEQPAEQPTEPPALGGFEASATPGQASPADLLPVGSGGTAPADEVEELPSVVTDVDGLPTPDPVATNTSVTTEADADGVADALEQIPTPPEQSPNEQTTTVAAPASLTEQVDLTLDTDRSAATVTDSESATQPEIVAKKRVRRPRRRAQRPAGSPEQETSIDGSSDGDASEPATNSASDDSSQFDPAGAHSVP